MFGGEAAFPDGVTVATDGVFALYRASGAVMFAGGTFAAVSAPEGTLRVSSDGPASISAECAGGVATLDVSGNVQYDTWGGVDHYREPSAVSVVIEGTLWNVDRQLRRDATAPRDATAENERP